MSLSKEDYQEPVCAFDTSQWKDKPVVKAIPVNRIIEKLDELYGRNDLPAAVRLADYWIQEARAGNDLSGEFALRNELMGTYRKMGNRGKALENAAAALRLIESMGQKGSISEGTALVNTATVYRAFDMPAESLEFFRKASNIYEAFLKPGDPRLGGLYNNMGVTLSSLGRFDEAIELYFKAIDNMRLTEGSEGEQAVSWLNMADAYYEKLGPEGSEVAVYECCNKAIDLLNTEGLQEDVNYAFYCEKSAPVLGFYGFFAAQEELRIRAEEMYSRP